MIIVKDGYYVVLGTYLDGFELSVVAGILGLPLWGAIGMLLQRAMG